MPVVDDVFFAVLELYKGEGGKVSFDVLCAVAYGDEEKY